MTYYILFNEEGDQLNTISSTKNPSKEDETWYELPSEYIGNNGYPEYTRFYLKDK